MFELKHTRALDALGYPAGHHDYEVTGRMLR